MNKAKYLLFLIIIITNCSSTSQMSGLKGEEFYVEGGSKIIVGELVTEEGFPVSNIDINVNRDFIKYPQVARRAGIEGKVTLYLDLSVEGTVIKSRVTRGIGGGCDEASLNLIKNSEFSFSTQTTRNTVGTRYYISILYLL